MDTDTTGTKMKKDISPTINRKTSQDSKIDCKTTLTENQTAGKPIFNSNPRKEAENKESTEEENSISCWFCWEEFDNVEDAAKHENKENPKFTKCLHCKNKIKGSQAIE